MSAAAVVRDERGFTLTEMLVASAIMLTITGAVFQLMNPARGTFQAQPELSDMQQRMRVAIDSLSKDLIMAGAGTYSGATAGALHNYFAPVLPYRFGDTDSDPHKSVFFREDAITVLYVPTTPSQTTIRDAMPKNSSQLKVEAQANCPPSQQAQLCGFKEGMRVVLFDVNGAWDPITIKNVQAPSLHLGFDGQLSAAYDKGATISQLATHTYYLETNEETGTYQLRHYDGVDTDLPIVDNVVKLAFEYLGEAQPPQLLPNRPLTSATGPWTTYGPKPPALGQPSPFGLAAGENCTFAVQNGQHVPRLQVIGDGVGQVPLASSMLTDGPWCPSTSAAGRYDADLLRVRRVRVTMRVQVAPESLRGQGELFVRSGTSTSAERYVPDQEIRFDISPRNLNLSR